MKASTIARKPYNHAETLTLLVFKRHRERVTDRIEEFRKRLESRRSEKQ